MLERSPCWLSRSSRRSRAAIAIETSCSLTCKALDLKFERLPFELIPSYWTTDATLTLRNADGHWAISGFVQNIENKRRDLAPQSSPIGVAVAHYSAPRTYGLRLSADF